MNQTKPMASNETAACPACGGKSFTFYMDAPDFHYGIDGIYSSKKCTDCGLVLLDPILSAEELGGLYPKNYYSFQPPVLQKSLRYKLSKLMGYRSGTYEPKYQRPGTMLDLGCGSGEHLLEMREKGWTVIGSELNEDAAAAGRSVGLDIRSGELFDAKFSTDQFDYIRLNHSFEHMPNPQDILTEVYRILKPNGELFIAVPNIDSFAARMFKEHWWYLCLPVHVFNYTPQSLKLIAERNGFMVRELRFNATFSGLAGSWQIARNSRDGVRSADGGIFRNPAVKAACHVLAKLTNVLRSGDCIELICRKA
jgi:SAM-dependent methyltransferase